MTERKRGRSGGTIEELRERMLVTIDFIERVEEFPSARQLREIIANAVRNEDARTLRLVAKEVDAMALALPDHEREGLEALLLSKVGVDKAAERQALRRKVEQVLQRGTVASEKERQRLEEYIDMLVATGGEASEIAAVRRLLASE